VRDAILKEDGDGKISPLARRLLGELGLTVADIRRDGVAGKIGRDEIIAYAERHGRSVGGSAKEARRAPETAQAANRIPMTPIRKRIAEHMVRSKATSPHVLQAIEADFSGIEAARTRHGKTWKDKHGVSLTYLPFVARAACLVIEKFPILNATIEGDDIVIHGNVGLGIAIDLNFSGLIVPVIRGANAMSAGALAHAIGDLVGRARANKLRPEDFTGGTFTISNSGTFGTMITAPIINQPQVAILSTDGVKKRPVVIESESGDAIAIRPVGILAQSFDHRAFDGAYSAASLKLLKEIVEQHDWIGEF
jgi:2-oxoglutarate dehydrogenase E2 component (dihydrolipoamide succinyltransferase)